jgi:hypothetical protein
MSPLRLVLDQNMHTYFNPNVSTQMYLVDKCLKHNLCTLGMALSTFHRWCMRFLLHLKCFRFHLITLCDSFPTCKVNLLCACGFLSKLDEP